MLGTDKSREQVPARRTAASLPARSDRESIVNQIRQDSRIGSLMELYIIAGPNGVGKTTFARTFLPKYADCKNFINADLIARGMSPFSPEAAAVRAGRLVLSEIRFFAQRKVPFAFETTLSGRS